MRAFLPPPSSTTPSSSVRMAAEVFSEMGWLSTVGAFFSMTAPLSSVISDTT